MKRVNPPKRAVTVQASQGCASKTTIESSRFASQHVSRDEPSSCSDKEASSLEIRYRQVSVTQRVVLICNLTRATLSPCASRDKPSPCSEREGSSPEAHYPVCLGDTRVVWICTLRESAHHLGLVFTALFSSSFSASALITFLSSFIW